MQRFAHLFSLYFFIHMDSERDLTVPCLVMRSNQLTGSSCGNVQNFTSVLQHSKAYSKPHVKMYICQKKLNMSPDCLDCSENWKAQKYGKELYYHLINSLWSDQPKCNTDSQVLKESLLYKNEHSIIYIVWSYLVMAIKRVTEMVFQYKYLTKK